MDHKYNAKLERYNGDQLIERDILNDVKATLEHWNGWRRFDNSVGATAKIYMKVNPDGVARVYKYITRLGDLKTVYIIEEA